jgi:hypothetical protein
MRKFYCFLLAALLLSACAASPAPSAGFKCSHVTLTVSFIAGYKLVQEECVRWERKPDEPIKKPDSIFYKDLG